MVSEADMLATYIHTWIFAMFLQQTCFLLKDKSSVMFRRHAQALCKDKYCTCFLWQTCLSIEEQWQCFLWQTCLLQKNSSNVFYGRHVFYRRIVAMFSLAEMPSIDEQEQCFLQQTCLLLKKKSNVFFNVYAFYKRTLDMLSMTIYNMHCYCFRHAFNNKRETMFFLLQICFIQ